MAIIAVLFNLKFLSKVICVFKIPYKLERFPHNRNTKTHIIITLYSVYLQSQGYSCSFMWIRTTDRWYAYAPVVEIVPQFMVR